MDNTENAPPPRAPSALPRPNSVVMGARPMGQGLQEMSAAQHNARSLLPPQQTGVKRAHAGSVSQPEPKIRKTLKERGGECNGASTGAAFTTTSRLPPKGSSIASLTGNTAIQGTITRATPAPPRHGATSSFGHTIGPGSRPPAAARPKSSIFSKSVAAQSRQNPYARPATAMGNYAMEDEAPSGHQQNGTRIPQTPFRSSLQSSSNGVSHARKLRGAQSVQAMRTGSAATAEKRLSSMTIVTMGLAHMDINGTTCQPLSQNGNQAVSKKEHEAPGQHPPRVELSDNVTIRPRRQGQDSTPSPQKQASSNQAPPQTPIRTQQGDEEALLDQVQATVMDILKTPRHLHMTPSPTKSSAPYLTKNSDLKNFTAWDVDERLQQVESQFKAIKEVMDVSLTDKKKLEEAIDVTKTRANEIERERSQLAERNLALQFEVNELKQQSLTLTLNLEAEQRRHQYAVEDKSRQHQREVEDLRKELQAETERLERDNRERLDALDRHHRAELDDERSQKSRELQDLQAKLGSEQQDTHLALQKKDREIQDLRAQIEEVKGDVDREHTLKEKLNARLADLMALNTGLEEQVHTLRCQIRYLESDSKQQSDQFSNMEARMQEALKTAEEARQKLIKEETERRVLFNKYQELKGNIRVMCRVRPVLGDAEGDAARIAYPDVKTSAQIEVTGEEERSSLGKISRKIMPFEFDRVFSPSVQNEEVFGEISQLVQSALDGYNVCIFCYGQTGSGKTYTMSSADGMIPRATHMIYDTITQLKEKSWSYTMEGSFVEVYNEELQDLLGHGRDSDAKKKLEIRHDEARKSTTVVNCKSVRLDSADKVEAMLREAMGNRAMAATKANERSSRSHCVFMLRLQGENSATGERCEGTLNLVDLAGSERLKLSGAEGDRMRETQNINRSLSCLGDVIEALGEKRGHIPYRNSKLTHLLQYSLGGNSKTLMFVMVSPLEAHLRDTMASLKFATKVHNTHIGTAKSTKKAKETA